MRSGRRNIRVAKASIQTDHRMYPTKLAKSVPGTSSGTRTPTAISAAAVYPSHQNQRPARRLPRAENNEDRPSGCQQVAEGLSHHRAEHRMDGVERVRVVTVREEGDDERATAEARSPGPPPRRSQPESTDARARLRRGGRAGSRSGREARRTGQAGRRT
jgi:hypothetical protein